MATTASHSSRELRRRLVAACAAVLAAATLGAGLGAAPAAAAKKDPCVTAKAIFRSYMNQARFWIGVSDKFAALGDEVNANKADAEANYYLDRAEGALDTMSATC
jgi:hypothetical protein